MLNKTIIPQEIVVDKILPIRNQKVLLDIDLAQLYELTTKQLIEQVKENNHRFPENFMFQITNEEKEVLLDGYEDFKSLKKSSVLPYAFTEHGVMMLANILTNNKAIATSIQIVEILIK